MSSVCPSPEIPPAPVSWIPNKCEPGCEAPSRLPGPAEVNPVGTTVFETSPPSQNELLNTNWCSWLSAAVLSTFGYADSVAIGCHHPSTAARLASCSTSASRAMVELWWNG